MRLMINTLLALLVIAAIIPFILPLKSGEPLLKWSDINLPQFPDLPNMPTFSSDHSQETSSQPVTTYKWQDIEGNWHISDTSPSNTPYETVTVDPNTNLIQASTPTFKVRAAPSDSANNAPAQSVYSQGMAYDPAQVRELINKARNVENLLQQRQEQQNRMLESLQ